MIDLIYGIYNNKVKIVGGYLSLWIIAPRAAEILTRVTYGFASEQVRTSTQALTNATLPYVQTLADAGWEASVKADEHLAMGVNMVEGRITCPGVAEAHGMELTPLKL